MAAQKAKRIIRICQVFQQKFKIINVTAGFAFFSARIRYDARVAWYEENMAGGGLEGKAGRDEAKFSNSMPPYVFPIFFHLDLEEIFSKS